MITILYVDDEEFLLKAVKLFLELDGSFSVDINTSASAALELLQSKTYDAIIADYQMPGIDGIELLKQVRGSGNNVPFILFTGRGREEVAIQALNEGADYYLQKGGDPKSLYADLTHKINLAIQKRRAEAALEASEEQYRAVVEVQTELICRFTPDGRLTFVNDAYCRYFNLKKDQCLGQRHSVHLPPDDARRMTQHLDLLTVQNPVALIEHRIQMPDGTIRWQRWNDRAIFNKDGQVVEYQSVGRDITEQKEMEENLQAFHDLSMAILNSHSLPEAFPLCLDRAIQLSQMDCGGFYLVDRDTGGFHLVNSIGVSPEFVRDVSIIPEDSEPARILFAKKTFYVNLQDFDENLGENFSQISKQEGLRTLACIPILHQDTVIAGLTISSHTQDSIPKKSRNILELIVLHIGNAIGRILSEEALSQSEEQYRVLIEHIQDGAFVSQDGILLFCNEALASMVGYTKEEAIGMPIPDFIAQEDRDMVMGRQRDRLAGKILQESYEFNLLHRDGSTRIPVMMSVGIGTYRGRPAVIGTLHNMTWERERESALRENAERLNTAQRLARMGDATWDLLTGEVTGSDWMYEMMQYDRSETVDIDKVNKEIIHPEDRERVNRWLEDCLNSDLDVITPNEYRFIRRDGKVLFVHTTGMIHRVAGKPIKVFVAIQDITERKEAEFALRESEEKFRMLSENARDGIFRMSLPDGRYEYVSPGFTTFTGYSPEHFYTNPLLLQSIIHPDWRDYLEQMWKRLLAGDVPTEYEFQVIHKSGEVLWVNQRNRLITGTSGNPVALEGVVTDITQRKHVEIALRNTNRQLILLTSITRHDINNQISAILLYLHLVKTRSSDPKIDEFIVKMELIIDKIQSQIEFTRMYEDLGSTEPRWLDMNRLLQTLNVPAPVTLVSCVPGFEVYADVMLERVFFNLLDNSLRHGQHVTDIRVSTCRSGDGLVILWEDNGVGIPHDEKEQIFERGFGKDNGLGLFLVKEILGITDITIKETGQPEKGARFEILLPKGTYRFCIDPSH